ncbi:MAG TPA: pyrrolo-quinoline quinone [Terriglobia bacterium]|nr:pyrrolo-quinoline quinone [Terriglobia bacterium]
MDTTLTTSSKCPKAMLFAVVVISALLMTVTAAAQDVLTWHNDNARTGQNLDERILTLQNVNPKTFGKLFVIHVDGKVDAEPLYVKGMQIPQHGMRNVLYVATENDSLYAFNADTGSLFWHVRLLKPGETPSDNRGCGQVIPTIGVTSTPVIDRQRGPHGTIYAIAMSKDQQGHYFQRLHALDLQDGREEFAGPVDIHATYPGNGDVSHNGTDVFDPKQYEERAALLLVNGVVYTSWASHCDIDPYNGWVIGYNAETLKQAGALDFTPNGEKGSVWQSGAGPAADPQGYIYLLAANGSFDTTLNAGGFPSHGNFGNSFLKISTEGGRLTVADYFTMYSVEAENDRDDDLGSGGPLVLPRMKDASGKTWHLVVGAGKDLSIYIANRYDMGKFNPKGNQNIYQEVPHAMRHAFSRPIPAYFDGRLYYASTDDTLREYRFQNARLIAKPVSETTLNFIYPGATPSVSADGARNGIVWATENKDPAVLHAYGANNLVNELYNSNQAPRGRDHFGTGNKFITPMIANGKVYVGTTDGVGVFGLLNGPHPQDRKAPGKLQRH